MLAKLVLKIANNGQHGVEISSIMQGVLMEQIPSDYAEALHGSGLNPYTQHLEFEKDYIYWHIAALTDEAYEKIIINMQKLKKIELKQKDCVLEVESIKLHTMEYSKLLENTYFNDCPRKLRISFITPTAFKVNNQYQFYPTVEHVMKSLISKHDSMNEKTEVYSEEFIKEIEKNIYVSGYKLKSTRFPLEGINVPSFKGSITITIRGPQQFVNLINMLCLLGEYTGVGIKTGIGMGAIKVEQMYRKEKPIE